MLKIFLFIVIAIVSIIFFLFVLKKIRKIKQDLKNLRGEIDAVLDTFTKRNVRERDTEAKISSWLSMIDKIKI